MSFYVAFEQKSSFIRNRHHHHLHVSMNRLGTGTLQLDPAKLSATKLDVSVPVQMVRQPCPCSMTNWRATSGSTRASSDFGPICATSVAAAAPPPSGALSTRAGRDDQVLLRQRVGYTFGRDSIRLQIKVRLHRAIEPAKGNRRGGTGHVAWCQEKPSSWCLGSGIMPT